MAQSLDYALDKNWYALPSRLDVADFVPDYPGVKNNQTTAEADVFYIHPTTYFKRLGRNDNFKQPSSRRITRSVVMNQATAFNQCFKIYAPKYRQAASWVLRKRDERTVQAMELAYGDIELAFEYYIRNNNEQRPFVIAAHGQGSYHALKLLERRIEGSPLQNRMVAAYLGGIPIGQQVYDSIFQTVPYCQSAEETGCLLNWQTLGESGYFQDMEDHALYFSDHKVVPISGDRLCVNPLSWKIDSNHTSAMHHTGSLKFAAKTEELQIVMDHHLSGNVRNGYMYISKPKGSLFNAAGRNYHIYDYNIFYLNIRSNACERLQNWKLKSVRTE
jgi:hypothetical protein